MEVYDRFLYFHNLVKTYNQCVHIFIYSVNLKIEKKFLNRGHELVEMSSCLRGENVNNNYCIHEPHNITQNKKIDTSLIPVYLAFQN